MSPSATSASRVPMLPRTGTTSRSGRRARSAAVRRGEPVPMRLPPHLAEQIEDGNFPLQLPTRALAGLAGGEGPALRAMVEGLVEVEARG